MCRNKMEWAVTDIANALYGYVMVPIAENQDVVSLEAILSQTQLNSMFVSE